MEIKNSNFLKSATKLKDKPTGNIPEIAFVGKSNVGKSSLINSVLRHNIVKTSSTPGRTRLINYFAVNDDTLRFVDLPGYGFNLASKNISSTWDDMLSEYMLNNKDLKLVVFIVDIRHEPTALDQQMQLFLFGNNIPYLIVATKSDKIAKSKINNNLSMISRCLKVTNANLIGYSADNGYGRDILLDKIDYLLKNLD